jgi:anion-transporting  ArsA/GET3 family ATPase
LERILDKRVILVTGKGGVGRSSITAAFATVAARAKKRVLVTEIGEIGAEDSPLARLFGYDRLPHDPTEIAPGIKGSLLLSHKGQELFLRSVLPVPALTRWALSSEALQRLLSAAPSFREMGIFYHLLTLLRAEHPRGGPEHEVILIDMPATGHTLALTGLPEVLLGLVSRGPIAAALREGQSYLNDPAKGAAWIVTLPEALPVSETLELLAGLENTAMPVGGIVLNRMPEDPFTEAEREAVKPLLEKHELFGAMGFRRADEARKALERLRGEIKVPLLTVPERREEGRALIAAIADGLENKKAVMPVAAK